MYAVNPPIWAQHKELVMSNEQNNNVNIQPIEVKAEKKQSNPKTAKKSPKKERNMKDTKKAEHKATKKSKPAKATTKFEGFNTKESAEEFVSLLKEIEGMEVAEIKNDLTAMTALALTLVKEGEIIGWKQLVTRFNEKRGKLPQASMYSDPSAGKHDGWNLRNKLWEGEHRDGVLHVISGNKSVTHAKGHGQLVGLSIMPKTAAALKANASLVQKLHRKFFSAKQK